MNIKRIPSQAYQRTDFVTSIAMNIIRIVLVGTCIGSSSIAIGKALLFWDQNELSALAGVTLQLEFRLQHARLFSFRFPE
eukprot:SAG31_NODE_2765_length_5123_cov_4.714541_3_plen_80_part_00